MIIHLILNSKTKNYESGPYQEHVIRPTVFFLNFTIKTLQLCSNYQGTLIKPQESKMASYIHKILNQKLDFSISFWVKPNTLKLTKCYCRKQSKRVCYVVPKDTKWCFFIFGQSTSQQLLRERILV